MQSLSEVLFGLILPMRCEPALIKYCNRMHTQMDALGKYESLLSNFVEALHNSPCHFAAAAISVNMMGRDLPCTLTRRLQNN
jgi:hypothetical protein